MRKFSLFKQNLIRLAMSTSVGGIVLKFSKVNVSAQSNKDENCYWFPASGTSSSYNYSSSDAISTLLQIPVEKIISTNFRYFLHF